MTAAPGSAVLKLALIAALSEGGWPIYRTEDDRGLEVDEYLDLFQSVLTRLAAKPDEDGMNDPADAWDAYCAEVPAHRRSPQSALAFGFAAASTTGEPKR